MAATWLIAKSQFSDRFGPHRVNEHVRRSYEPRNVFGAPSERRSMTILRLPRLTLTKTPLIPGAGPTEMNRVLSPPGGSTLITSAPMSAMIWVQ
jgi:hypothetical protein